MKVRSICGIVSSGVYVIVLRIVFIKMICRYLDGILNKIFFSYLGFLVICNIFVLVMYVSGIYRKLISDIIVLFMVNFLLII